MFYYYMDPTYILVLIGVVICMAASSKMNRTFQKYSRVRSHNGMTGREAAERILHSQGIYDVRVEHVSGNLTDHYDPRNKVLRLSDATWQSTSVAAIGVAAHECGHALQHARGYVPLSIRSTLAPVASFGSGIAWPLIILGLIFNNHMSVTLLNASRRALNLLGSTGMLYEPEVSDVRKVLTAAALTYVAGTASAILQLLRILILTGGRRND